MSEASRLLERLRAGLTATADGAATQVVYEAWFSREQWRLADEGVPLLVGCDPARWSAALTALELEAEAMALTALLARTLGATSQDRVTPFALRDGARRLGVEWPRAAEALFGFIASVLPPAAEPAQAEVQALAEREVLLGAALALVTRFPEHCRDAHGFFDGARIADQILAKAVLWFPLEPPRASRDDIAALIERYLS